MQDSVELLILLHLLLLLRARHLPLLQHLLQSLDLLQRPGLRDHQLDLPHLNRGVQLVVRMSPGMCHYDLHCTYLIGREPSSVGGFVCGLR